MYEFPISEVQFYIPKWVEMLPVTGPEEVGPLEQIAEILNRAPEVVGKLKELFDDVDAARNEN